MSSAHLQLAAKGQEDRWLSESPDRTYFEAKYQPRVNRSRETYEVPLDNQGTTFGMTGRCTIPVKGDYLTRLTLRAVFPPIYPTVEGEYVFPTPSSQVGASVYANMGLTLVVADGVTLTANTVGNHYMSVGTAVTLSGTTYSIFDLDGTYTVTSIPTANSFTCSTTLAGISYNGTMSFVGIACGDIISYFSTANSNLWVNNITNKTWSITNAVVAGNQTTITTSTPSGFSAGQKVYLIITSLAINGVYTVVSATDTTFTITTQPPIFVAVSYNGQSMYSLDNGVSWTPISPGISGNWLSIVYGNRTLVAGGNYGYSMYSINNGISWTNISATPVGDWSGIAYGNGTFVAVSIDGQSMYSNTNVPSWTLAPGTPSGQWSSVAYGNGTFVAVSYMTGTTMYSNTNVPSWTLITPPFFGLWQSVAYGNGTFVAVSNDGKSMYSNTNGQSWTSIASTPSYAWRSIAYGNGTFVAVAYGISVYSNTNVPSWTVVPVTPSYSWRSITYGNGTFVAVSDDGKSMYSNTNVPSWTLVSGTPSGQWYGVAFTTDLYTLNNSDLAYLEPPPLGIAYNPSSTNFNFYSNIYPRISFANSQDAAFWGFDFRQGSSVPFVNGKITSTWTLTQGGWITGFLPPSASTWDDSVAHKLVRDARILVGKQTIKEYTGEYIELQNDLTVPYENKAILKLLNGTLDQTQATVSREYYTTLPLGTKEIPLCALTHQQMSVEIDFEAFTNLSQNLNQGTGDFLDAKSYTAYNASTGILGGQPVNVQTTFSYQQYIFIVTYGGQFIVYDTTKDVADPTSYIVLSAFSGTSLFSQFCVLSGTLYIGLSNGKLLSIIIDELIQGNTSSSILNNYAPTIGTLTGTMVADFRYVYYAVSNTATSNVFMTKYDTTASFTNSTSYTSVDFTKTFNSSVTSVYQIIATGVNLIAITNTPRKFYTFSLNGNFTASWNPVDYSSVAYQITSGVLIGKTIYFIGDSYVIIKYLGDTFTPYATSITFVAVSSNQKSMYSTNNGISWIYSSSTPPNNWSSIACGNGTFVAVSSDGQSMYSTTGVPSWTLITPPFFGLWQSVAYGNGTFVAVSDDGKSMYSTTGVPSWTLVAGTPSGQWSSVAYGNGTFVAVSYNGLSMYSNTNGQSWTLAPGTPSGQWDSIAYGNGTFVAVSYNGLSMYSNTNVPSWTLVPLPATGFFLASWAVAYGNGTFVAVERQIGKSVYSNTNGQSWSSVTTTPASCINITYGNGTFVAVGDTLVSSMYSINNGISWTAVPVNSNYDSWSGVTSTDNAILQNTGSGLTNLLAVGTKIYASSNSSSVSSVIQIDTTKDLNTSAAYKYYTSQTPKYPITFDGTAPKIFANGPRYVYMFSQGNNSAQNIYRYDPYPPTPTLQTSILVDYESLPLDVPKPDKALLGLVQTQKVTDMNYMNIRGPVKELWVTGVSDSANVFQYSNLAAQSTLALTAGEEIITEDVGTRRFLNTIEPFETHTSMPIRNVSVIPFELDPESDIPNGTVNFSRIRDQVFNGGAETVWARTYNLLAIQGGIGGLIFNS